VGKIISIARRHIDGPYLAHPSAVSPAVFLDVGGELRMYGEKFD